jgi:hypothetical protein
LTDYATLKKWKCLDTDTGKDLAEEVRKCHIPIYPGEVWSESQGSILLPRRRSAGVPAIENDALPTLPANSPDAAPLRNGLQHDCNVAASAYSHRPNNPFNVSSRLHCQYFPFLICREWLPRKQG